MLGNSFYGTQGCHRPLIGQLGDICASAQYVLALTQWVTPGNQACLYSLEQFRLTTSCLLSFSDSVALKLQSESGLPERLVKTFLDTTPRISDSVCQVWCMGIGLPASYQVMLMLLVWGLYLRSIALIGLNRNPPCLLFYSGASLPSGSINAQEFHLFFLSVVMIKTYLSHSSPS